MSNLSDRMDADIDAANELIGRSPVVIAHDAIAAKRLAEGLTLCDGSGKIPGSAPGSVRLCPGCIECSALERRMADPPQPPGTAEQYTRAIDFLRDQRRQVVPLDVADAHAIPQADKRLAWLWLTNAQDHLAERLDAYLRMGHTEGQEEGAVLKSIALGLETASRYLFDAASRLKAKGDAHGASVAHQASVEIHQLFEEISGVSVSEEADP